MTDVSQSLPAKPEAPAGRAPLQWMTRKRLMFAGAAAADCRFCALRRDVWIGPVHEGRHRQGMLKIDGRAGVGLMPSVFCSPNQTPTARLAPRIRPRQKPEG